MKGERDPKEDQDNTPIKSEVQTKNNREDSPVIYRPEPKKDYYIPKKITKDQKDNSKNDSMNVSNIISSLVEANKNKLVAGTTTNRFNRKNDANFDKLEEFKIFPKKKTSSIYEPPGSNSKPMTSRSGVEDHSFDFNRHSFTASDNPRHLIGISLNQTLNQTSNQQATIPPS